jgi:hypothetical protein
MSRAVKIAFAVVCLSALAGATLAGAEIARKGNLQLTLTGEFSPKTLPRSGDAPIAVTVGGKISTTDGSAPPQLKTLAIDLNRSGRIDTKGLPLCPYSSIQPGSSSRALSACRSALVGKGSFKAEIVLAGQDPYPTSGRMLLFNGSEGGKNVLFGHIYAARPFATSFVIVFKITGIEIKLQRIFSSGGERRSYLSAGCPTPKGVPRASFPLTRTTFGFKDGRKLSSILVRNCTAAG